MNLVFLSTFEKEGDEGQLYDAQVTIGETQGLWNVQWMERQPDGKTASEMWYEGTAWDAMLHEFRRRVQDKWLGGYSPLIDDAIEGRVELTGKSRMSAMLQCYGDKFANADAFEKLREWRREQAAKEGKAAYLIATNRVLRMLAAFLPRTREELAQIPWLGEQKARQYGPDILRLLYEVESATTFPLDWVEQAVEGVFEGWLREQQQQKLRSSLSRQEQKQRLLTALVRGGRIDALAQELAVSRRELVQRIEELDEEGYDVEPLLNAELEEVNEQEREKAWLAFEQEGFRFLKPVLHRMYSEQELKAIDLDRAYEWLRLLRLRYRKAKKIA